MKFPLTVSELEVVEAALGDRVDLLGKQIHKWRKDANALPLLEKEKADASALLGRVREAVEAAKDTVVLDGTIES